MLPDFNRLKIFYHIFSSQSIAAAAATLNITPSAVSQQLKKLEHELKTPLFTRPHKRMVPTAAGKRLFDIVQPFVHQIETGIHVLEKARATPSGLLKIGAPVEFGTTYIPAMFSSFRENYPDVTFFLKLGQPSTLLPMVGSGDLDFAFVDTFPTKSQLYEDMAGFSIMPVIEEEVVLACSKAYQERYLNGTCTYANLTRQSFVSQQNDAWALKNWFRHHFGRNPAHLKIILTVESHQAVVSGIRHHLGLGIIVSHIVSSEINRGNIVPIQTNADQAVNRISLIQLKDKVPSLTEKFFQTHFIEELRRNATLKHLRK
jgi:DNA-binding transcriptional LysR family regulator